MGLDITAYKQLTKTEGGDVVLRGNLGAFAGREDGIAIGTAYHAAESFDFRAGSYGGYGTWREQLAKLAGYPPTEHRDHDGKIEMLCAAACWNGATGPFSELINFADNEGTIGPVVARKLAADFAQFEEQAKAARDGWFSDRYRDWKRAFEMAAQDGAVEFH